MHSYAKYSKGDPSPHSEDVFVEHLRKKGVGNDDGHLLPSGLVVGVVDLDDVLHVLWGQGALLKLPA